MEFLAGAMLWGTLAAGLPILLHLTGRSKPVRHRFPALRFIKNSQRSSSRALRLKHLLLLLLRILGIVLLALALARPLWPWPAAAGGAGGARIRGDFVLLLDASMSMNFQERETTRFERARRQALAFLDRLAPEARVALVRATEDAELQPGRLTLNHARVRRALRDARPEARGLDLHRALKAARLVFAREHSGARSRAVILCTDLQRNAFQALRRRGVELERERKARWPPLVVLDVGRGGQRNGAVLELRLPGPTVAAEANITLSAKIRPVDPARITPVDLYVDGVKVAQKAVEPHGAQEVDVPFAFQAGPPGPHVVMLKLAQGDGLLLDQQRALTYVAGRPPRALLVEQPAPEGSGASAHGTGFFLRAALASPAARSASGLSVTVEAAANLRPGLLRQYQVLLLADPGPLDEAVWAGLKRFVDEGGGLFFWLGRSTNPKGVRGQGFSEFERHGGLLPGRIGAFTRPEKPLGVRLAQAGHPLLARFPPGVRSVLRRTRVRSYVKVTPEIKDSASAVVLELGNGAPLLLEKSYGRGRVLFCTVGPDLAQSDLAKHGGVFVTFVLEACRMLSGRGGEATARLGRPLTLTLRDPPADGIVRWKRPGARRALELTLEPQPKPPKGAPKVTPSRRGKLVIPRIETPGVHRFSWKGRNAKSPASRLVALNPSAAESDLKKAGVDEAKEALKPWRTVVVQSLDQAPLLAGAGAGGRELPALLLLSVLLVLLTESFLANRLYGRVETSGGEGAGPGATPPVQ